MKRLLLIVLPLLLIVGCVPPQTSPQTSPVNEQEIEDIYQLVQTFDLNNNKDEIFDKVLEHLMMTVVDYKSNIKLEDKENGKIILNNITQSMNKVMGMVVSVDIHYTLKIETKNNKIRLIFNNFVYKDDRHSRPLNNPQSRTEKKYFLIHLNQSKDNCKQFSKQLIDYLKEKKVDEW